LASHWEWPAEVAGGIAVRKDPIGVLDHCSGERTVRLGQEHCNEHYLVHYGRIPY